MDTLRESYAAIGHAQQDLGAWCIAPLTDTVAITSAGGYINYAITTLTTTIMMLTTVAFFGALYALILNIKYWDWTRRDVMTVVLTGGSVFIMVSLWYGVDAIRVWFKPGNLVLLAVYMAIISLQLYVAIAAIFSLLCKLPLHYRTAVAYLKRRIKERSFYIKG